MPEGVPLPPVHLGARVGATHADNLALYDEFGAETRDEILSRLPSDWTFEGRTVLDFGCGAGRTLRHFVREAEVGRVLGCDIHAESVQWLQATLCPPLEVFENGEVPPLALTDGSIELIWAISVFTHLTDHASAWLLELHRVLAEDGLLITTFNGSGTNRTVTGEDWDPDRIGMTVLFSGQSWDTGGPAVVHSPWWIREHWGRLFEIVSLEEEGFAVRTTRERKPSHWQGQGIAVLRRKPVELGLEELERVDPAEAREIAALRYNLELVQREARHARTEQARLTAELVEARLAGVAASASGIRARLTGLGRRRPDAPRGG
jgi:SAM-dependent methyltransferase